MATTTSEPNTYLFALLTDTDAVATQVLEQFASTTEITGALQTVMASESYNAHARYPP